MSLAQKLRTEKLLSFTLVVLTLCVGILIGTLISVDWGVRAARGSQAAPGATPLTIPNPMELSTAFSQIAKQVEPSVVHITVKYLPKAPAQTRNRRLRQLPAPGDEGNGDEGNGGIEQFFQQFINPFGGMPEMPDSQGGEALGSGVVVDRAGYILTNNHVVEKADSISVKFTGDPLSYDAKVIGVDEPTDLAVIRVEGKSDLVPAKIGNSDGVGVGDWAVAIGSPFDFQNTVTAGIISATGRDIPDNPSQYQHFLQTDAAINPGNSGGPLLNIRGEVIGINTAIASTTRGYQGIGFALPINTAAQVYNQIIKNGKVTRGSIGIKYSNDASATKANLQVAGVSEGVYVSTVQPGGPAEKAGIKDGDVIVSINGKPLHDGNDLVNAVVATPVGATVTLGTIRDGKHAENKVVVEDICLIFPESCGNASSQPGEVKPEATSAKFGMKIQGLTDQKRESLGIKQSGGVLIASVEPNSFAEDIHLAPDDVILAINGQAVNSTADVECIESTLRGGQPVSFRVLRRTEHGEWAPTHPAGVLPNSVH
jgi:serine protease Do